jgi:hypothetical protein
MAHDVDERRSDLQKLQVVSAQRARLRRGSSEWRSKLREEERLVAKIRNWALGRGRGDGGADAIDDWRETPAPPADAETRDSETKTDMDAQGPDGQVYGG